MSTLPIQNANTQEIAESLRAHRQQKDSLQEQNETEMENLKRSWAAEKADLQDRYETSVQAERLQHYENLKNLKNQMNREAANLEANGRQMLSGKQERLKNEELQIEKDGRFRLGEARRKMAAMEEYERNRTRMAADLAHREHLEQTTTILEENRKAVLNLQEQRSQYLEQQLQNHAKALEQMESSYLGIRDQKMDQHARELEVLEGRTADDLEQRTLAASLSLSDVESRRDDPFYALQRVESQLEDAGTHLRLRVRVPEHERGHLRIQASGDHLEIIGVRSNEAEASVGDRTVSTRSHQTWAERIPLPHPIDPRSIQRSDQGDWVEYTLGKQGFSRSPGGRASLDSPIDQQLSEPLRFRESLPRPTPQASRTGKGTLS